MPKPNRGTVRNVGLYRKQGGDEGSTVIQLSEEIVRQLSSKGVLAYVAVNMAGYGEWSSATLASLVACKTEVMKEGMEELSLLQPEAVQKEGRNWAVGGERTKMVDCHSEVLRRMQFIDDLKKYWEHMNPDLPYSFDGKAGKAVSEFLRDHPQWSRWAWQRALNNRAKSEGIVKSEAIHTWVRVLDEYASGPLDRYGKSIENGGGAHGKAIGIEASNRAAREAALANRA